jgi:hypothetical protein
MLADTRAYFTAATCAILLFIILSINTPSTSFPIKIKSKLLYKNTKENEKELIKFKNDTKYLISFNYNEFSIKLRKGIITKRERELILLNQIQRSIIIGLILGDAWIQKRGG